MSINIRPRQPEDDDQIVDIFNRINLEFPPGTVEELRLQIDHAEAGLRWAYLVAESGGRIDGGGLLFEMRNPDSSPFFILTGVDPEQRRRGIGGALYDRLLALAEEWKADRLLGDVLEGRDDSLAFASRRGFEETGHGEQHSRLDVSRADLTGFEGEESRLTAEGITIRTLADFSVDDRVFIEALHRVNMDCRRDIPGAEPQEATPIDDWVNVILNGVGRSPEWYWVALDGEIPVGLASLKRAGDDCAWNGFTGVIRDYRGRGIARALKLRTIEWCRTNGVKYIYTGNEVANRPMLAINKSMGYEPLPRSITVRKVLTA